MCIQWNLSIENMHNWDPAGCRDGVANSEVDFTQLYVFGTADSLLIREVPFIQSVLYREVPLCLYCVSFCPEYIFWFSTAKFLPGCWVRVRLLMYVCMMQLDSNSQQ